MTSRRSPWHDRFCVAFFHDLPKRCDQTAISFDGNDAPASSSGDGGRGIHGPSRLQSAGVASSPAAQEQIDLPTTEGFRCVIRDLISDVPKSPGMEISGAGGRFHLHVYM